MDYSIKIDEFEGPLDLLLHLIKQNNVDIMDIDIFEITKQYLDYIDKMEELNINVSSEYIVMAAELMEIKSKLLLPSDEKIEEEEDTEVSKEKLINKLLELEKYKEMSEKFKEMEISRQNIYVKSPENINKYMDTFIVNDDSNNSVDDLVDAFKKFLERIDKEKPLITKITSKEYSVKERKNSIRNILKNKNKVLFTELFDIKSISYIIVTFLSILEMTKEKEINLIQDKNFMDIMLEMRLKS